MNCFQTCIVFFTSCADAEESIWTMLARNTACLVTIQYQSTTLGLEGREPLHWNTKSHISVKKRVFAILAGVSLVFAVT